jgi:4-aminobutyrate aminotransferase
MSFVPSDLRYAQLDLLEAALLALGTKHGLNKVKLRDLCGSTAMEFAIKLAHVQTGRRKILAFERSHHGQTTATIAISGSSTFRGEKLPWVHQLQQDVDIIPLNSDYGELKDYLQSRKYAAVIIEPVLGNGGNIPHAPEKFAWLRELCTLYGTELIVDEVQTGFGRTGNLLACETFNITPDIVVVGKGLGNGYPVAAVLYNDTLGDLKNYQHSFTTGAHPTGIVAGWVTERRLRKFVLYDVGPVMQHLEDSIDRFHTKYFKSVERVTGVGMMWGIHLAGHDSVAMTNAIVKTAREHCGLRVRSSQDGFGNVVKIRPALIATIEDINEIMERLSKAFDLVLGGGEC